MEKKNYPAVHIGSASMLVIFIILCLVTFSVLSLASANNDRTYARNIADRTEQYYTTCNQAEETLAVIDSVLTAAYRQYGDSYLRHAEDSLHLAQVDFPLEFSGFPVISFSVPLNDTQELFVSLQLQVPSGDKNTLYQIISWKEISVEDWNHDEPLNLM